jgi:electron transfer flavoprotein beta subunit
MVKIIVLLKDVVDLSELKIDPTTRRPRVEGVKKKISDVDKRALEAAIRLKESHGGEIIVLSMGDDKTKTSMVEALAMGADESYVVNDEFAGIDTLATSKVLTAAIKKIGDFDLIICGELTLDSLSSQIGPRVAELLDFPQITYVKNLELEGETLRAVRDLEDVDEVVEVQLPSVVSVVREIGEPRIPSLMNIMKAKRKPRVEWDLATIGLSLDEIKEASSIEILSVETPPIERKRIRIRADSVDDAADKLVEAILKEGIVEV